MSTKAIDLGARTLLRLSGSDRQRYLNGQVSNDVRKLDGNNSITACVTTLKGKLDALVHIIEHEGAYLIDSEPELREPLLARLDRYIIADDCELDDVSDDWRLIHVLEDFEPDPADAAILARRSERLGQSGTDQWLPAGAPLPGGLTFLSADEAEALRIRNGVPKWGAELTPDTLPAEAGLDLTAIDFHKGCYIGQEVISRIKSVGRVNRKLVRLRVPDEIPAAEPIAPGMRLFDPDRESEVGVLTSVAGSEALGFVKRDHDRPGTRLQLAPPADAENGEKKFLSTSLEIVEDRQAKTRQK
jgi:folate-binding protein YgfZ